MRRRRIQREQDQKPSLTVNAIPTYQIAQCMKLGKSMMNSILDISEIVIQDGKSLEFEEGSKPL
jgi:hypothetical protein